MEDWQQRFVQEWRLRNYSYRTIKSYSNYVKNFADFFTATPLQRITREQIKTYVVRLIEEKHWQAFSVNQLIKTIRSLYVEIFNQPLVMGELLVCKKCTDCLIF